MKQKTTQDEAYKLHISQTNRDGSFYCPSGGAKISPDDQTEESYALYDVELRGYNLAEVVIYCKNCLRFIHLGGFSDLYEKTTGPKKLQGNPF